MFSIEFRSGLWVGQSKTFILRFLKIFEIDLAVWMEALSCWKKCSFCPWSFSWMDWQYFWQAVHIWKHSSCPQIQPWVPSYSKRNNPKSWQSCYPFVPWAWCTWWPDNMLDQTHDQTTLTFFRWGLEKCVVFRWEWVCQSPQQQQSLCAAHSGGRYTPSSALGPRYKWVATLSWFGVVSLGTGWDPWSNWRAGWMLPDMDSLSEILSVHSWKRPWAERTFFSTG